MTIKIHAACYMHPSGVVRVFDRTDLRFPLALSILGIKPAVQDSEYGVFYAMDRSKIVEAVKLAWGHDPDAWVIFDGFSYSVHALKTSPATIDVIMSRLFVGGALATLKSLRVLLRGVRVRGVQ